MTTWTSEREGVMRVLVTFLLAAGLAVDSRAQETGAAPTTSVAAEQTRDVQGRQEVNAFVADLRRVSAPYDELAAEVVQVVETVTEGSVTAQELYESRSKAKGRAWAASWVKIQKQRLGGIRDRVEMLPQPDEAVLSALESDGPAMRSLIDAHRRAPAEFKAWAEGALKGIDALVDDAAATAQGDEAALDRLGPKIVSLGTVGLEAENRLVGISLPALPPTHPQRALSTSIIAGNTGVIEVFKFQGASLKHEKADGQLAALQVRRQAQAVMTSAAQMEAATDAAVSRARTAGWSARGWDGTVKGLETYKASAGVEREVAQVLESVASELTASEVDWSAVEDQLNTFNKLRERRVAIQMQRVDVLAP
jgi:hypothetical protein